jgi:methionyl-tRNA formyltransferase
MIFMGTPGFACPTLEALFARSDDLVVGVVCQPDRPRGRGLTTEPPPVKQIATAHGIPVLQPERARDPGFLDSLRALAPDVIVVAAYGKILPRAILDLPPHGCVNVHASLLPRHRGAAPIQWSILAGDPVTGITIMAMNEEMDAGDILLQRETAIAPDETGGTLTERLSSLGATALVEALDALKAGALTPRPQPAAGVTFAPRIEREHCRLDWRRTAIELERQVRAYAPAPAAFTTLAGRVLKVHRAGITAVDAAGRPGEVLRAAADGIVVATGAGALVLRDVQLEGRKRLAADQFLAGNPLPPGTCLGG